MREDEIMIEYRPITLDDRDLFMDYIKIHKFQNSEYNFTTLFAWQNPYQLEYAIVNSCLCVKSKSGNKHSTYFPMGEPENIKGALLELKKHFNEVLEVPLLLLSLSEKMLEILKDIGMEDEFTIESRRDFFDYIYQKEKLTTLAGKKLHGKRNHFNFFQNNYEYELRGITDENEGECRELMKRLVDERSLDPMEELNATFMVLKNRDKLELSYNTLYVDNVLVGIILGECHHNVSVIHIAKADISYRGASVALFKLFLMENLEHCYYVNFMEDMGLEGLRKAKMSYYPEYFIEKSELTQKM